MRRIICICDSCGKEYSQGDYPEDKKDEFVLKRCDFKITMYGRMAENREHETCGVYELCPECGNTVYNYIKKYKLDFLKKGIRNGTVGI